ncbi:MAG: hypothetical protein ACI8W8_001708 [Rhodothermales bacterium]
MRALKSENAQLRVMLEEQTVASATVVEETNKALESQPLRLQTQAELMGELEQAQFAAKDARAELAEDLREGIDRLASRQERVEAF